MDEVKLFVGGLIVCAVILLILHELIRDHDRVRGKWARARAQPRPGRA